MGLVIESNALSEMHQVFMHIDSAGLSLQFRSLEPHTSDFEHVSLFDVFCVNLPFPKSTFQLSFPK
jgi:hypothetical protein